MKKIRLIFVFLILVSCIDSSKETEKPNNEINIDIIENDDFVNSPETECRFCKNKDCDYSNFRVFIVVVDTALNYNSLFYLKNKIKKEFTLLEYSSHNIYNQKLNKLIEKDCDMNHYLPRRTGYYNEETYEESWTVPALSIEEYDYYSKNENDRGLKVLIGMMSHEKTHAKNFLTKISKSYSDAFILETSINQNECFH